MKGTKGFRRDLEVVVKGTKSLSPLVKGTKGFSRDLEDVSMISVEQTFECL